jgi:hypothetical protein
MASWKDTIKDDDGTQAAPTSSWKNTIQDEPEKSLMDTEIPYTPFVDPTVGEAIEAGKSIGQPLLESAQDFSVGAAQGATLGAADEIGGVAATGFEKLLSRIPGTSAYDSRQVDEKLKAEGFQVPEESLADTYRSYQKGSEAAFQKSADRSPIINTLGNIAGGATTGIAAGKALGLGGAAIGPKPLVSNVAANKGKIQSIAELMKGAATTGSRGKDFLAQAPGTLAATAPIAAAESVLNSKGTLTDEQGREKILQDMGSDLAVGLPAVLGVKGAVDVAAPAAKQAMGALDDRFSKFVQDNPFLRKYGIGIKHGEMGTKPTTEAGLAALEGQQIDRTKGMMDNVYKADKTLGQAVGKSIDDATAAGTRLDIAKPVTKALTALNFSYNTFQDMAESARGRHIFEKIQKNMGGDVDPTEAKGLLDDVDAFIGKFNASRNRTTAEEATLSTLNKVRKELSDQMKKDIPAYGQAAERFTEFRRLVPETILAKDRPADVADIFMGNLRNSDQKLYDSLNELQMGASSQGSGSSNVRKAFGNVQSGMKQFETNEATRNAALQAQGLAPNANPLVQSADDFAKQTRQFSDEANFLKDVQTVKSPFVTNQNIVSTVGQLGHSGALSTSLLVGKAKKPIMDAGRKAYNMPAEKLNTLADQMMTSPGLKVLGQALKSGLENGDQAKKNAAIFSILQNPEARLLVDQEEEN